MGASMCVPVCMFVRTSTVLLPSRWCVVMSVTWIASNCGQIGIRSPHGCVRSTSVVMSVREVRLAAELRYDPLHDGQVDDVLELQVLADLAEVLLTLDRAFDEALRHALVLRRGLRLDEGVECRLRDRLVDLAFLDGEVDDLRAVRRVVHRAVRPHERTDGALERRGVVLDRLRRRDVHRVLVVREDLPHVHQHAELWVLLLRVLRLVDVEHRGVGPTLVHALDDLLDPGRRRRLLEGHVLRVDPGLLEDDARHHVCEPAGLLDTHDLAFEVGQRLDPRADDERHVDRRGVGVEHPHVGAVRDGVDDGLARRPGERDPARCRGAQGADAALEALELDGEVLVLEIAELIREVRSQVHDVRRRDRDGDGDVLRLARGLRGRCCRRCRGRCGRTSSACAHEERSDEWEREPARIHPRTSSYCSRRDHGATRLSSHWTKPVKAIPRAATTITGANILSIRKTFWYVMIRLPSPPVPTTPMRNSATIIPIRPRPIASRMPARTNGSADGMTTSPHRRRSLELNARATSRRSRSMLRTPCCVLMRIGKMQKRATETIRGASPWNLKTNPMSGMSATDGTERSEE